MTSSSRTAIFAALAGNCLIAATKFGAALLTGSSAMMSEVIHSVVDTGNEILLLYGLRRPQLPADEEFPFGHGKEVYFWSFVVALLIFAAGAVFSIYKGISNFISPKPVEYLYVNYIVIGLSAIPVAENLQLCRIRVGHIAVRPGVRNSLQLVTTS